MAFDLNARAKSFRHAIYGMVMVVRREPNAWIHLVATVSVVALGFYVSLSRIEWCAIVLAIGLVWVAEAANTAIEYLADEVTLEQRKGIGLAKDVGAGAVLLASITAAIIGAVVFVPHVLAWWETRP